MAVKEDDRDRGVSQGAEVFGPKQPTGEQAEFRISKVGVEVNFRKQGLLSVYSAISIPSGNTTHLNMDPFLTQDDMTFPKHVHKVFFVRRASARETLPATVKEKLPVATGGVSLTERRDQAPSIRRMAGLATACLMAVRIPMTIRVAERRWCSIRGPVPCSPQRLASRSGSEKPPS